MRNTENCLISGRARLLAVCFVVLVLASYPAKAADAKNTKEGLTFEAAWNELAAIPSWMGLAQSDTRRKAVLNRISRMERYGADTIYRLAVEVDRRAPKEDKALIMGANLFVLNKVLFAVPKDDRTVLGHYPLTMQPDGSWVMDGLPPSGGGYDCLSEKRGPQFQRLQTLYGLRSTYVEIAGIGALDTITSAHVGTLLDAHGINSFVQGTIVWDLNVPKWQASRAEQILRQDAAVRKYWIRFLKPDDPVTPKIDRLEIKVPIMLPYSIALEAVGPVDGLNLRRVLEVPKARGLALQYPHIVSATVMKQGCLSRYIRAGSTKWHYRFGDAYRVDIQFSEDLGREDAVTTERRFFVIDGKVIPLR